MLTTGSLGRGREGAVVWAAAVAASIKNSRKTSLFRTKCLDVFCPKFIDGLAGVFFPQLGAIAALPHGGVEFHDDFMVFVGGKPFEESAGDAIAVGVFGAIGAGSGALVCGLVLEPANGGGQSFPEPAGVASTSIFLGDVHQFVYDGAAIVLVVLVIFGGADDALSGRVGN